MFKHQMILIFMFLGLSQAVWSRSSIEMNDWQCYAADAHQQKWVKTSSYQRMAINRALDACRKASYSPESCQVAKEYCKHLINGHNTQAEWRCTALDDQAKIWMSNAYSNIDDAAIAALAYCKEQSSSSDSCYINMVTCKNMNIYK